MDWKELLRKEIEKKSKARVAKELGVSAALVTQAVNGTYAANTEKFAARVLAIYGQGGMVKCPARGEITPMQCAETHERAKLVRLNVGNRETFRRNHACIKCRLRG